MGAFRAARRVRDPDGKEWELYVLRYRTPRWKSGDWDGEADDLAIVPIVGAGAMVWDFCQFLWYDILLPLGRFPVDMAVAIVRGRGRQTVWIEAVSWDVAPRRDLLVWRTTDDHYRRVLNEIAVGLAEGELPEPLGAPREYRPG